MLNLSPAWERSRWSARSAARTILTATSGDDDLETKASSIMFMLSVVSGSSLPIQCRPTSGGTARTWGNLPEVSHVSEGHEDVGAVGVQPEALGPVVASRDEFAVVDAGAVNQGHAHPAALEVLAELGCLVIPHGFHI